MTSRLPAEWEPQSTVWLTWPHEAGDWGDGLDAVHACFLDLAQAIAAAQPALICACNAAWADKIAQDLQARQVDAGRIRIHIHASNDVWTRDYGALSVVDADGAGRLVDFRFNGWGGKFRADLDDALAAALRRAGWFADTPFLSLPWIVEGGALDTDGQGTLLVRESAVRTETRNPGLDRADLEAIWREHLGVTRVHWLRHGHLQGDDTDGHIDTLARFCDPGTIAYQACDDPRDPHYAPLRAMAEELADLRTPDGQAYALIPLPMPQACFDAGLRLPAGYANFLILNGRVLLPIYACPQDIEAQIRLAAAFPDREIIPIDCRALIRQNGSLHCATMQFHRSIEIDRR